MSVVRRAPVTRRPGLVLPVAAALLLAACGAAPGDPTAPASPSPALPAVTPAATSAPSAAATSDPSGAPSTEPTAAPTAAVLGQPWATAELVDVTTGDRFTIAGLVAAGRPVILETMAIWCTNCKGQQERIEEALAADAGDVAYVVLTVDPSEDEAKLARYREQNEFDGIYAVAGRDVARALAADFGDQVLNPPSTPVVVISPSGQVTLTPYGPKSVADLEALLERHRA